MLDSGRRLFRAVGRFCYRRRWVVLGAALLISVAAGVLTSRLQIAMTWLDMVPAEHPSVTEFYRITERFGAATSIVIALENPDPAALKKTASKLAQRLGAMESSFRNVRVHEDRDFLLSRGLMLETEDSLEDSVEMLSNLDLEAFFRSVNDDLEKSYIGGEESLEENELEIVANLNGLVGIVEHLDQSLGAGSGESRGIEAADRYIDDMLYTWSADRKMILVTAQPRISVNDIPGIGVLIPGLREELARIQDDHPGTRIRMTGMHVIAQDEMETATSDSLILTNIAFIIILLGFVVAFRMWGAPLLAMLTLIMGILWDLGLTALIVGRLNLISAMMAVILLGLGVDYFIHVLSGYTEARAAGLEGEEAMVRAMDRVGTGVFMGAVTTAIAFSALILVNMTVFKELGVVLALGVLCTMIVSLTVLPAALAVAQPGSGVRRRGPLRVIGWVLAVLTLVPIILIGVERLTKRIAGDISRGGRSSLFTTLGRLVQKHPRTILAGSLALVAIAAVFLPGNWFDQNLMNMEMKGLESVELQREIVDRYGLSDSALVFTTTSVEETQRLHEILDNADLVGLVDSIAAYLPSPELQAARLPKLKTIHDRLGRYKPASQVSRAALSQELHRLVLNLREISEMATLGGQVLLESRLESILEDPNLSPVGTSGRVLEAQTAELAAFQQGFGGRLSTYLLGMSTPAPVQWEDLPASITERYASEEADQYLSFVYAKTDVWERVVGSPFIELVQKTQPSTTGMPVFMKVLIADTVRYGRTAILVALAAIVALIAVDLRSPWLVLMALAPLALGSLLMLGILGLARYPFNIMMVSMLPLIIGIGIDDGIHLLHRWRIEGDDMPAIMGSVGKALFLTTFTTMVAFGSLAFAKMQAYVGMGIMLFVGMGTIYLMTVTFVPALLTLTVDRKEDTDRRRRRKS